MDNQDRPNPGLQRMPAPPTPPNPGVSRLSTANIAQVRPFVVGREQAMYGNCSMSRIMDRFVHWFIYKLIPWYTSLGLSKGTVTLEVRGRKTGRPIHISLTTVKHNGSRYLVSLYDKSQWLKNVRAAKGHAAILSSGRRSVRLVEIPPSERAPILLGYVQQRAFSHSGEESAKLFFGLGPKPKLADMEAIADRYVVFRIESLPAYE